MVHQVMLAHHVRSEVVIHVSDYGVDVVGAVLNVIVLDHEAARVDSIVVAFERLSPTCPGQMEVADAFLLNCSHLVMGDVVPHLSYVLGDQGHQHFLLCAVHLRARQSLLFREDGLG